MYWSRDRHRWTVVCQFILFVVSLTQTATANDNNADTDVDAEALNTWQSNSIWNCNTPPVHKRFATAPYVSPLDGRHRILLHGGSIGRGVNLDETWIYSVETNVWTNVTDENIKPLARRSHSMVTLCNDTIILFGGKDNKEQSLNETWMFETDSLKWRRPLISNASHVVPPMFTHAAVVISSRGETSCQCKQSVLVIPGPSDKALDWSTVWELACVEDKNVYQWSRVRTKQKKSSTPKGNPRLATGTGDSEVAVIALSNGLWTYRLTDKSWKQVHAGLSVPDTAIAVYFPFLQSYVIIMDTSYMRYNLTSGNLTNEAGMEQNSISTRGGAAAMFGSYAIVYRGAIRACRQSMVNLTRKRDGWLAYRLPDSLMTPIFGYQCALGVWKGNLYVTGSPNEETKIFNSPKGTLWKLNLSSKRWFQLENKGNRTLQDKKITITNTVFLQNCECFLGYRRHYPNELDIYYPDEDKWEFIKFKVAPQERCGHSFVAFNSTAVLLFSGFKCIGQQKSKTRQNPEPRDDLWILSVLKKERQWYLLDSSIVSKRVRPKPRALHASAVIDNLLLIYGGVDGNFSRLTDMWSFNMTDYCWTEIEQTGATPVLLNSYWKMIAVTVGHQMIVTVGCTNIWNRNKDYCKGEEQQSTWMYDPHINKWTLLSTTKLLSNLFVAENDNNYQNSPHLYKKSLFIVENRELTLLYSNVLACPLGLASPDILSTNCQACPIGTYSDGTRKTCTKCPRGLITEEVGSFHVSNCSRCVDDYCSHGDCILTVASNKPAPGCQCHFGFTGTRCQTPTYIILGFIFGLCVTVICLSAAYCINKWRHKQLREGQLQRHVEELTSVWQIGHDELQVLDRIGEGGYGKVHKAVYREVEVAVKLLRDVEPDYHLINEFEREILFMQTVRHPNIVMFIGAGLMDDGSRFLVTEFMHRGSLRDVLEANKADGIGFITQIEFAIDAAKGMEFLHSLTPVRIHRDLKSPNLLVSRAWMIKVADFGLGRQIVTENSTREQTTSMVLPLLGSYGGTCTTRVGTVQWRAPELSTSKRYGISADAYSFGVVLWEMQTCDIPFSHYSFHYEIENAVLAGERPPIPSKCNEDYKQLITDCWHADPTQRPAFSEILNRLNSIYITCHDIGRKRLRANRVVDDVLSTAISCYTY